MTNDIDWEAEIEALDASLPERLERAAQMAERSDIWTDTERLMPATGVADLIWEAHSEILGWRALNKLRQDSRTCPLGEDCALIPDAGAALQRALEQAREEGRREERKVYAKWSARILKEAGFSRYPTGETIREDDDAEIRARAAELKEDQ